MPRNVREMVLEDILEETVVETVEGTSGALLALSNNLADAVEIAGRSVAAVHGRRGTASSGVHWQPGVIVTADHTLDRDDNIQVTLPTGQTVSAVVAGRDAGTDLAVLRVEGTGDSQAQISDTADLRIGHVVVAVARPGDIGLSASMGSISALGGPWRTWSGGQIDQLVRPDLTLYPGFSGGALVNTQGHITGIVTSGLSRSISLAVPTATIERVVSQLLRSGRISRGYLGLGMQPVKLPESLQSSLTIDAQQGLIVVSVESEGPAARAGVLVGDILIALDGKPVSDTHDVQSVLDPERVDSAVTGRLIRGGKLIEQALTVGERPRRG